jgi:hypothetical protein
VVRVLTVLVLVALTGCALERLEDDALDRRASAVAATRPTSTTPVVAAYCQWLERCGASEMRRDECWMRVAPDACDADLASMCRGEIDAMTCRDGLSVRCDECFAETN